MSLADIEHLPKVVTDVDGIRDILLALDPEIVLLREDISQLIKELYVSTTEKYIDRWEQDFSLPYDGSLTLEQRRQRVKNKLARKKVLNWQNLRLLIKNNIVKPRFYIVNEAENYHFKIFLEQQPQKQEFDLSNFTVVGSPTITEDGVASGFSSTNYLIGKKIDFTKPFNFKFRIRFNTEAGTTQGTIFALTHFNDYNNMIKHYQGTNGKVLLQHVKNGSVPATLYQLDTNVDYDIIFSWDGSKYEVKAKEITSQEWHLVSTRDDSTPITISSLVAEQNPLTIGARIYGQPFTGSIDLKQLSITVDGKEVFSGVKNIDYITNELRASLKQAKPAYLTYDIIVTEFFTRYCGTFSSGTEPL